MADTMTLEETMAELIRIGAAGSACVEGSAFHWLTTLKAENERLRGALQRRCAKSHNDTCEEMLSEDYACTCGQAEAIALLKETESSE